MKKFLILIFCFFTFFNSFVLADRIKDMASIAGVRTNQLVGYGLVVENVEIPKRNSCRQKRAASECRKIVENI